MEEKSIRDRSVAHGEMPFQGPQKIQYTLYIDIDDMVVSNNNGTLRCDGEGESVIHLMSENMVCRVDPFPNALLITRTVS